MKKRDITLQPLNEILQTYGEKVQDLVIGSLDKVATETVAELKANSPRRKSGKKQYYKGWTKSNVQKDWKRVEVIIYNKNKPSLTHLLNDGYARKKGGRVNGDHHIDMAEDYAIERLEEIVIEELSRI